MNTQNSTTDNSGSVISTGVAIDPLDALARKAQAQEDADRADDHGDDHGTTAQAAAPVMTNAQCLLMAGEILRETMCSFANVTTPLNTLSSDKLQPAADALGAVLDKHGVNLSGAAGDYMIEIKAAILILPLVIACRAELKIEIAQDKAKHQIAAGEANTLPVLQPQNVPQATPHYVVG